MLLFNLLINILVNSTSFYICEEEMKLTDKIKEQHGSLNHFCKIAGINARSLSVIIAGGAKSQPCVDALIKYGFINSINDLPQYQSRIKED